MAASLHFLRDQRQIPVQVGRYVDGQGYRDERKLVSLNFKARIVCISCNTGWMSKMESEVEQILKPQVGYVAHGGLNPFRLFPDADPQVPENIEFKDVNHFLHSIVLRTWAGCAGEVPSSHD